MKMGSFLYALVVLLGMLAPAQAHEARPLYVEITERQSGTYSVKWQTPPTVPLFNHPQILPPDGCARAGNIWTCDGSLAGQTITIDYPKFNPSVSTLLRVRLTNGQYHTILGSPDEASLVIPSAETPSGVAQQYGLLGIEHIFAGYDHLLFLVCLLFIAGTGRRILIVVTGFTLAHSITLAASALGLVRVPVPPIEAIIALSVLFLAVEIAKAAGDGSRKNTLTWRHPIAVSSSFGLLHGFGFASVLADIGLPQTETTLALLFFNLGIELGQLAFIALVLALAMLLRQNLMQEKFARPAAYVVGSLSGYWLIDRLAGFPW